MPSVNPPVPEGLPGKRFRKWAAQLLAYIESVKPVGGIGTSITEGDSGRAINATPSGSGKGLGGSSILPDYPTDDGTYVLGVVVSGGGGTLQWIGTDTCA